MVFELKAEWYLPKPVRPVDGRRGSENQPLFAFVGLVLYPVIRDQITLQEGWHFGSGFWLSYREAADPAIVAARTKKAKREIRRLLTQAIRRTFA